MVGAARRGFWISFALFLVFFLYLVAFGSNLWRLEGNIQIAGLVLAIVLLGGWLVWRGIYAKARFPRTGLEWVFAFGLAVLCLSWAASPDPGQGGFRAGWLAGYLVFFIVMLDSLDAGLNRWGALAAFLTISGLLLFQALVETFNWYSQWWPFIQKVGLLNVTPYRFSSMLIVPGPVMAMGAMGFPMAVLATDQIQKTNRPCINLLLVAFLSYCSTLFLISRGLVGAGCDDGGCGTADHLGEEVVAGCLGLAWTAEARVGRWIGHCTFGRPVGCIFLHAGLWIPRFTWRQPLRYQRQRGHLEQRLEHLAGKSNPGGGTWTFSNLVSPD